ncbi:MAG: response regulator transcription factor [Prolixibacteraceae bacterium]|nr:response regulator transcription factor [Prolixibacteraceae bacterium]
MKLLVVDDNAGSVKYLKGILMEIKGISTVYEADSAEKALYVLLEKKPDILVCSDNLNGKSAFDLAYLIEREAIKVIVVILSNNQLKAVDAIRSKIFDFILLPCSDEKIKESVYKAIEELKNQKFAKQKALEGRIKKLRLSTQNGFVLFDIGSLVYCKADGSYTHLHFDNGKTEYSSYYLGKIERLLKNYGFSRINRSILVNSDKILRIDKRNNHCIVGMNNEPVVFKISDLHLKHLEEEVYNN